MRVVRVCAALIVSIFALMAGPASAQQTGSIVGKVADNSGAVLPGVTVTATSSVLPTPRVTTSGPAGEFRLPALPPGNYQISFELQGMQTLTRNAVVQLQVDTTVNATLGIGGVTETVEVTAVTSLVDPSAATIKSGVSNEQLLSLPVGQEYRDIVKLIPGVQFSPDTTRGPSAGGSGQDNVYQFDGANVTLPLFGTLSAEPATHDIAQVTSIRGGARAVDFNRSGGFSIDSVSKSGTNTYRGLLSFQVQSHQMVSDLEAEQRSRFEQDRTWLTGSLGGPIVPNKLFFYASYYRPERTRGDQSNLYGSLPDFESTRNEGFGKLTFTPTSSTLVNASYRHSKREDQSDVFGDATAATAGSGDTSEQQIATVEGSWIINTRSLATAKFSRFGLETQSAPDNIANIQPTTVVGTQLDVNNLHTLGALVVPVTRAGETAYNAFIQPLLERFGYIDPETGLLTGGGVVGFASEFNDQDFFHTQWQVGYNLTFGERVQHDVHAGYQWYVDEEDLLRNSNGLGVTSVPGGRLSAIPGTGGQRAFYTNRFQILPGEEPLLIHSEYQSHNIELNDTIRWNDWTFDAGVLLSRDTLFGQGLREDESTLSGFVAAPGNKYEMYQTGFGNMIQPRVGATWAYNGRDTIFASYARYTPAASSLPRAASWDRNLTAQFIDAHYDANGVLFASVLDEGSSGKLFQPDMTPRRIDEFVAGTARQISDRWSVRLFGRYREGSHFWEDTNNTARTAFDAPPHIEARGAYISNLNDQRDQIGSGSSYVIAELDDAYTKYQEVTLESEWRGARAFVRGSYTWSHYYGNFDQDNTTTDNDANVFVGSSFLADGAGRQIWNFRDGTLRGDRPHMLKLYGYYALPWNASIGAFAFAQSGQPWEIWSYEPYIALTTSTSDTSRYAEPAGSRRSDSHAQLDLNYTQTVRLGGLFRVEIIGDLFNVFDTQTGFNIDPREHSATFQVPRDFYDPRRFQLSARIQF
jgi:hypothetical protein